MRLSLSLATVTVLLGTGLTLAAPPSTQPAGSVFKICAIVDHAGSGSELVQVPSGRAGIKPLYVVTAPVITEADLSSVRLSHDPTNNAPVLDMELTDAGAKKLFDFTSSHIGQQAVIFVDGKPLSAPMINSALGKSLTLIVEDADKIYKKLHAYIRHRDAQLRGKPAH